MAGVYRPRHPERSVLHRVLSHHFERFLTEYESRFEREYGLWIFPAGGQGGRREVSRLRESPLRLCPGGSGDACDKGTVEP